MKHNCDLVKDILPLYHDSMCSVESRNVVREHFMECAGCKRYYDELCQADVVAAMSFDNDIQMKKAQDIKNVNKIIRKQHLMWIIPMVIVLVLFLVLGFGFMAFLFQGSSQDQIEVYTDINRYEDFMSKEGSGNEHEFKFGMEKYEFIFPDKITDDMNVKDYKMVTYCPWEREYLSYLVVEYDDADYDAEVKRLKSYEPMEYIGLYEITGFEDYTLLTIMSSENYGFIYALTDDENTIIYVEMIFWAEHYSIKNYEQHMPADYFPEGFNAHESNETMEKVDEREAKENILTNPQGYFYWLIDQIGKKK